MKIIYLFLSLSFLVLFFCNCNSEKKQLLATYQNVYQSIQDDDYEKLMSFMDNNSINFIDHLTNPNNLEFNSLKRFGKVWEVPLFTQVYGAEMKEIIDQKEDKNFLFFFYLKLSGIPVFNWVEAPKLLEDQTFVSSLENYVVVGTRINKNTLISSKIKFTKDENGTYKLDLLSLLSMREKILRQHYNNYAKILSPDYKTRRSFFDDNNQPVDSMLIQFLDNRLLDQYQLKELRARVN